MYNHAPAQYTCPICLAIKGVQNKDTLIYQTDIVYKDDLVCAFISSFFIGNNSGHLIIVPNEHIENIFDLTEKYYIRIFQVATKLAIAMKKNYNCTGITFLQNNEPDGGQHAFHYHLHIFPRYYNDNLYKNMLDKKPTTAEERLTFAEKIKNALSES